MTSLELNRFGYRALTDALGFDGLVRFEPGQGNYIAERQQRIEKILLKDIFNEIENHKKSQN